MPKADSTEGVPAMDLSVEAREKYCLKFIAEYQSCLKKALKALQPGLEDTEMVKIAFFTLHWCDRNAQLSNCVDLLHRHSAWKEIACLREDVEKLLPCVPIQLRATLRETDEVEITCTNLSGNELTQALTLRAQDRVADLRDCIRKRVPIPAPPLGPTHGQVLLRLVTESGEILDETKDLCRVVDVLDCSRSSSDPR
jgi:hypothetical protein